MEASDIIAICAVAISFVALGAAIWQGCIAREHNIKSMKPFLVPNVTLLEKDKASLTFTNKGIGPAFVKSMFFHSKGKFERITNFDGMRSLLKRGGLDPDGSISWHCSVLEEGAALIVGETRTIIEFPLGAVERDMEVEIMSFLNSIIVKVEYECAYGTKYSYSNKNEA